MPRVKHGCSGGKVAEEADGRGRVWLQEADHEDVAGLGAVAARAEELQQVVELAVDVATDGDRARNRLDGALLEHDLLHVAAQRLEVRFAEELALLHVLHEFVQHRVEEGRLRQGMRQLA